MPAERKQEFRGQMWLDDIDPELEVTPLLDSGTDCQDELSSPDGSPMVISPIVGLLSSQGEDDINLTQFLAEFGTLPAFVTPIIDQYAEGEMPPTEYHPPEVAPDLSVMPARPVDGVSSTRDLTVPAFPRGGQCSHYIRGVALRRRKSRRNFGCSLRRQRCLSQEIMRIAFESAQMTLMCHARALSTYIGSSITPIHHFVHAGMVRAVPSVSLRTIWI